MNTKVVFNTWSGAFFNPGGGEVQLLNTKRHLETAGVSVSLYDQWNPSKTCDIFHQFSIQSGVELPMREYKNLGKKIALSTILWADFPEKGGLYYRIKEIFDLADILLTNSDRESEKLSKDFEIELSKFHKTRNSISEEFLNTDTQRDFRKNYSIQGDFILSLANIDRRKNTHALSQACLNLNLPLVLIGHIRDQIYFDEFKGKNPLLKYVGPLSDSTLIKSALQQCSVYALPSICETPGIAALEAASQGAKIVITDQGPTEEYFKDMVTYVNPFLIDSITQGIDKELKLDRNPQMLKNHVISNYTWDQTARDVIHGYQKIL